MSRAYYNELDPFAARWLRNLIAAGHIADGTVDERDIREVGADELSGYAQVHLFAGIGGWSYALRLAGWPDDRPVWTGSCPCQPFSSAGRAQGVLDERHLWPAFQSLIAECRPATIFGEQVASADGRLWLAGVRDDLERMGYAVGAADLCAAGVGAPHVRNRIFWCADGNCHEHCERGSGRFGDTSNAERADPKGFREWDRGWDQLVYVGVTQRVHPYAEARRVFYGIPGIMDRLRGFGNAIVPQVAAEFIGAYLDDR